MKANNGKGDNPLRDHWQTPQELWDKLNEQYHFVFDCCASENNHKTHDWTNNFLNTGLVPTVAWMNPPFSFARKMFKHFFNVVKIGVAIYRCDNFETRLWQKIIFPNCNWVFIPDKRICYEGIDGDGARFPSALIGVRVEPPQGLDGTLLLVGKHSKPTNKR